MIAGLESVYPMEEEDDEGLFCECVEWRRKKKRKVSVRSEGGGGKRAV